MLRSNEEMSTIPRCSEEILKEVKGMAGIKANGENISGQANKETRILTKCRGSLLYCYTKGEGSSLVSFDICRMSHQTDKAI